MIGFSVLNKKKKIATHESEMIYPYIKSRWRPKELTHKSVKDRGSLIHEQIDFYLKTNVVPTKITHQFRQFLKFLKDSKLKHINSEVRLYNEKYIGILDAIFEDELGNPVIIDWKCSHYIDLIGYGFDDYFGLPICNYNTYSFQLHIYYVLLNRPNTRMILINFPDDNNYEEFDITINSNWLKYIQNEVDSDIINVNFSMYRIPFGKNRNKLLSELDPSYLNYLYNSTVYDFGPNMLNIEDSDYYCKLNQREVPKPTKFLVQNYKITINYARQYVDFINLCIGCFRNQSDDKNHNLLCLQCKP